MALTRWRCRSPETGHCDARFPWWWRNAAVWSPSHGPVWTPGDATRYAGRPARNASRSAPWDGPTGWDASHGSPGRNAANGPAPWYARHGRTSAGNGRRNATSGWSSRDGRGHAAWDGDETPGDGYAARLRRPVTASARADGDASHGRWIRRARGDADGAEPGQGSDGTLKWRPSTHRTRMDRRRQV